MKHIPIDPDEGFQAVAASSCGKGDPFVLDAGQATDDSHDLDRWLYVLTGSGRAVVAGNPVTLEPGTLLLIEAGECHEIRNPGPDSLEAIALYASPPC